MAGHVAPEAAHGGPIALVHDGDTIVFDIEARRLDVVIAEEEMNERRRKWSPPPPRYQTGVMAKYAKLVFFGVSGSRNELSRIVETTVGISEVMATGLADFYISKERKEFS